MAKIRTIKPEFWDDEDLAKLPYGCRLFYIGMWTHADDLGVCKANPVLLKSKVFPYDNIRTEEVKKWLDALSEARFLIPIQFKSESYYVIRTFTAHQKIDRRWFKATIPENTLNQLISGTHGEHGETSASTQRAPDTVSVSGGVSGGVSDTPLSSNEDSPPIPKTKSQLLIEWVNEKTPRVQKLEEPLTEEQAGKLLGKYDKDVVFDILRAMHNYRPLQNQNTSAYLTAISWIQRDEKNAKSNGNNNSHNGQKQGKTTAAKKGVLARASQLDGGGTTE